MGKSNHKKAGVSSAVVKDSPLGQAAAGWLPNSRTRSWILEGRDDPGLSFPPNDPT